MTLHDIEDRIRGLPDSIGLPQCRVFLKLQTWRREGDLGSTADSPIVFPIDYVVRGTQAPEQAALEGLLEAELRRVLPEGIARFTNRPPQAAALAEGRIDLLVWLT